VKVMLSRAVFDLSQGIREHWRIAGKTTTLLLKPCGCTPTWALLSFSRRTAMSWSRMPSSAPHHRAPLLTTKSSQRSCLVQGTLTRLSCSPCFLHDRPTPSIAVDALGVVG